MTDELITLTEAAERSGLSLHAIRKAATRGRLRTQRLGPLHVTTPDDLARYSAEVETWRDTGRQPRTRKPLPRSQRVQVEEVLPE